MVRGPWIVEQYFGGDGGMILDEDGWFDTGDLGHWRNDGRLHVVGRRGDLIISGGENVWPEAAEAALATHPGVADVMVRGQPDPDWGHVVEAVIVPAVASSPPSLTSLRDHVKASHPAFMAPRRVLLVAALPRTTLGKLRRHDDLSSDGATPAPPSIT